MFFSSLVAQNHLAPLSTGPVTRPQIVSQSVRSLHLGICRTWASLLALGHGVAKAASNSLVLGATSNGLNRLSIRTV